MRSSRFVSGIALVAMTVALVACGGADGEDGAAGAQGPAGADGLNGADGTDGTNGTDGVDGADGTDGVDGADGAPGADGTNGTDGVPGADGTDGADGAPGADGLWHGTLQGVVTETAGGTTVGGATISVLPAAVPDTQTAVDGSFSLSLPIGTYEVTATNGLYKPAILHVSIVANGTADVALALGSWKADSDLCIGCHALMTDGVVADYKAGAMAEEVSCQDCHGTDLAGGPDHNPMPTPATCATCHPAQYRGHQANRHSIGWQRVFEAGRFDDLPPCSSNGDIYSGGVATCTNCHNVEQSCDSCHSRHLFDAKQAQEPLACGTCHMGPDHSQYEIYTTSKHGVVYETEGRGRAPTCSDCHMPKKGVDVNGRPYTDHDLSYGIAYGPVGGMPSHRSFRRGGELPYVMNGAAVVENPNFDPSAPFDMTGADGVADSAFPDDLDGTIVQVVDAANVLTARREEMLNVCTGCHARNNAADRLDIADGMHENVHVVVDEAADILKALYFDGLLRPPTPGSTGRPNNPDAAPGTLVLGGPMIYRNLSEAERLYFKLYKYDFVKTWHGAYHMNPDYAHWYGWAESNLGFADIAAEAYQLRQDAALEYAIENGLTTVPDVPYQGVYWTPGSMSEEFDLYPAGVGLSIDSDGDGNATTYTGLTFH